MHLKLHFMSLASAAITACLLSSCIPPPKYIDLTQKSKIAVVGFSLDRTIAAENSKEVDQGPGLLQKMVKGKEKAVDEHFQYHKQALEEYGHNSENIQDALLGIPMVGFDEVVNNQRY